MACNCGGQKAQPEAQYEVTLPDGTKSVQTEHQSKVTMTMTPGAKREKLR